MVAPEAEAKLFITASVPARAMRRFLEMQRSGRETSLTKIEADLAMRDARDRNRAVAPLVAAAGAALLDTSELDRNAAIAAAIDLVERLTGVITTKMTPLSPPS